MTPSQTEKIRTYLLASKEELENAKLSPMLQKRIIRLRDFYNYSLQYPRTTSRDLARMIQKKYDVSVTQSYEDVRLIDACIGLINKRTRDFDRDRVRQWCEEAIELARKKGDAKSFASVISVYVKGTNLDKDETTRPDYASIVPQTFVFCSDPEAAGFKRIPGILEKAKKMMQKDIGDAQILEEYTADEPAPDTTKQPPRYD